MRKLTAVPLGIAAFLLVGCVENDGSATSAPDKYQQTWTKSYGETSCGDWLGTMTRAQRFTAAADMLTSAQHVDDANARVPSDDLVRSFQVNVTTACSADATSTIADIATSIYLIDRDTFGA